MLFAIILYYAVMSCYLDRFTKKIVKLQPRLSNVTDYSASGSNDNDDSGMDGPSRGTHKSSGQSSGTARRPRFHGQSLIFISFCPVVVVQNQSTGQWRASE
jgi:hypothetical protein